MKLTYLLLFSLIFTLLLSWYSCSDASDLNPNQPPVAVFSFTPEYADTSTVFTFDASQSSDLEDETGNLSFKWDFEGRQTWTTAVKDPIANYKYSKPGTYNVGLKVIDSDGWSGEVRNDVIVRDSL